MHILEGDCRDVLRKLPDASVHCCVTSPPYYGLRDYGVDGQIGLEATLAGYIKEMVSVFGEIRRVLRDDATVWLNLGDTYVNDTKWGGSTSGKHVRKLHGDTGIGRRRQNAGMKPKDLMMVPARVALALQDDGWWLRSNIVWAKPNGMPGSQKNRPTSSHEAVFLVTKSASYWSDFDAIKTPPRESTLVRLAQDVQAQVGSHRANGGAKKNGPMKAVSGGKQRGHSRRHAGFNDRWDVMKKSEQQSRPAMMRDVWFVPTGGYSGGGHFAVMPEEIARRCILAGCPVGGLVLDPFGGSGTVGLVADRLQRNAILIELNPAYAAMARARVARDAGLFAEVV